MGLPSGTRWCMYNLGVDPNNLEKNSAWLGEHYQWATPQIKSSYHSDNYTFDLHPYYDRKHMNPNASKYKEKHNKKYSKITGFWRVLDCHKAGYIEMDFEDDPAYVATLNKTFKYCTPTKHQFMELRRNCSERNVYNYQGIEGLAGKVFTSKRNGNEIFFPFAGYKGHDTGLVWEKGIYWTSTLDVEDFSCAYSFDIEPCKNKDEKVKIEKRSLYNGLSIRPVLLENNKRPIFKVDGYPNNIVYE